VLADAARAAIRAGRSSAAGTRDREEGERAADGAANLTLVISSLDELQLGLRDRGAAVVGNHRERRQTAVSKTHPGRPETEEQPNSAARALATQRRACVGRAVTLSKTCVRPGCVVRPFPHSRQATPARKTDQNARATVDGESQSGSRVPDGGQLIGYARVSTHGEDVALRLDAMGVATGSPASDQPHTSAPGRLVCDQPPDVSG
jgi:hypothetical protein